MSKSNNTKKSKTDLKKLFEAAESKGGLDYLYTLLRLKGASHEPDDLLITCRQLKKSGNYSLTKGLIFSSLELILFLLKQSLGLPYEPFVLNKFFEGDFSNKKPNLIKIVSFVSSFAKSNKWENLSVQIDEVFSKKLLSLIEAGEVDNFSNVFIDELVICYFNKRLKFIDDQKLFKLPGFEVLELLTSQEQEGLYGFKVFFSNGRDASFTRKDEGTFALNILFQTEGVGFMVGDLSKLQKKWMVGEKDLYEIGLAGRYNKWGEWKPLIYPGEHEEFGKRCKELSKGDYQIERLLFYIMTTGHRIIEFAVKTPIIIPETDFSIGTRMHLHKCDSKSKHKDFGPDYAIYDGHYELDKVDYNSIRSAIATINVALNRMAFAYDSRVDWCLKYASETSPTEHTATPNKDDLKVLNSMLVDFPDSEDSIVLDIGIDWYHRGRLAERKHKFIAFICFYIAIESVVLAVTNGEADLGIGYIKKPKNEVKEQAVDEINKLHDELYSQNPEEFVKEAYFNHVISITRRTRQIVELVFGKDHKFIKSLFEKDGDKPSLSDLRSKLAHGSITLLDRNDQRMIAERISELSIIAKEFFKRIIIKPNKEFPKWSGRFRVAMYMADPRATSIASTDKMFPSSDWKIKPEWIE